jgi:hypothetical protein
MAKNMQTFIQVQIDAVFSKPWNKQDVCVSQELFDVTIACEGECEGEKR